MLFVCDEHTMKRMWQSDQDYRWDYPDGNPSGGYLTLLVSLPIWWLFNDAYRWDDFAKQLKNFEKLFPLEAQSVQGNTGTAWKKVPEVEACRA